MIGREVLLSHSKAVATLGVQVQFSGFVSLRPLLVQSNTLRRESELIISRSLNSGEGLKTVRLGLVTLVTTSVFQTLEKYSFSG